ncbi:hypothetical protein KMP13_03900 [Epibacterium ulvae]|uniref:hypothetical protein n=1 Tax=Epibacterium ulvae TaxID=1156985 RepID=UPI001BFC0911|nr:hypothetical protein [Epibacterium ulvae]MBT8153046.1 hypothetical protein [Epibacterium ulvae]
MQEQLKNAKVKPAANAADAGQVQVKSVSSTGNIKISLKSTPDEQDKTKKADATPASVEQLRVAKNKTAKVSPAKAVNASPAKALNAKISKPSAGMTPKSLASASAQSDAAFALDGKAGRSPSLKPLGLAAAALGVLALGLGVLQFAGGKSEAIAQGEVIAVQTAPVPAAVEALAVAASVEIAAGETNDPVLAVKAEIVPAPEPSLTNLEPVSAVVFEPRVTTSVPEATLGVETVAKDAVPEIVTPSVAPDKAAIVAPVAVVQESVEQTEASGDLMQEAISAAMSKLGSPAEVVSAPVEAAVAIPAAQAIAEVEEAAPAPAARVESEESAGPHVSTAQKLLLVSNLSSLPDDAKDRDVALVEKMTLGTLAALKSPKATASKVDAEPVYIFDLVVKALADGLSEDEIDAALNEAYAAGQVTVPSSLVLADGRVDSPTILALFAN